MGREQSGGKETMLKIYFRENSSATIRQKMYEIRLGFGAGGLVELTQGMID